MRRPLSGLIALHVALVCTFTARAQSPDDAPAAVDPLDAVHATGDAEIDPAILRRLPVAERYKAFLPVAVDLTGRMPPVGNQKNLNSCTAWATAYAARSYYTAALERRDIRQNANLPSPNYVFHLARQKDCMAGSSIYHVVQVLKKGVLSLKDYPYDTRCMPPPSAEVVRGAHDFRVRGMRMVEQKRIDDIKGQIARTNPVIISFNDSAAFQRFRNTSETFSEVTPKERKGWHAITLVGYDDRRQAFRLINSWGQGWGDRGYAWIGYDVIKARVRHGAVLDVVAPQAPLVAQPALPHPTISAPPTPAPAIPPPQPPPAAQMEPDRLLPKAEPMSPATPPPAKAEIADLQILPCAKISVQTQGERKSLAGFVSSAADLELVKRVATDVPAVSLGAVSVAPWPQCEALLTLEAQLAAADRPGIAINPPGVLYEGDRLRLEIQSPGQISYIYVVYIKADGSVVTLTQPRGVVPQPTLPRRALTFGHGSSGHRLTISRPFGREMIIALASHSPLFEKELSVRQTAREFLSALRRALIYKPSPDMPDRELMAAMTILETRAK